MDDITPEQCRAARALLGWSQADLEAKAKITQKTIADFELSNRNPRSETLSKLRHALERGGVDFIEENGGGAGVRLRKRGAAKGRHRREGKS